MHIKFLSDHKAAINDFVTKTWPAGWFGHVDDKVAAEAIEAGVAEEVPEVAAKEATGEA